jgi:hypothetical protein
MKKLIRKLRNKIRAALLRVKLELMMCTLGFLAFNRRALCGNKGEGYIDTAVFSVLRVHDTDSHDTSLRGKLSGMRRGFRRLTHATLPGEGYVDTAVTILISIVVGALLLAALYALFGDVVMPTLEERIREMFDYAG